MKILDFLEKATKDLPEDTVYYSHDGYEEVRVGLGINRLFLVKDDKISVQTQDFYVEVTKDSIHYVELSYHFDNIRAECLYNEVAANDKKFAEFEIDV